MNVHNYVYLISSKYDNIVFTQSMTVHHDPGQFPDILLPLFPINIVFLYCSSYLSRGAE
jgi:hypothetical protein